METGNKMRRPWKELDDTRLLDLWDTVGSVFVIARLLQRTRSSVQTRASRLGLPPRSENSDMHRKRWNKEEDALLDHHIQNLLASYNEIPIQDISDKMGRSIDALASRIEEKYGENSSIIASIIAPPPPELKAKKKAENEKPQKGKVKTCLKCRKSFWSEGNHNWICGSCKRSEEWESEL